MSVNLPSHFVSEFSTRVELLLQEKGSKLRQFVSTGTHTGKQASPVNQFGAISSSTPQGRFAPLVRTDAPASRRWVAPQDQDVMQMVDKFDLLRMIEDPKPAYAQNAALAIGRWFDDLIIDAALGTALIGETGTGSEAFDTTNYSIAADFGAAAEVGLTVAKLIEAQRIFMNANVDIEMEMPTCVISPRQHANLLNQLEVTSRDYQSRPVLESGRVREFMGMNFVVSNRLDLVNTDDRACFAFVKSGLHLGVWKDMTTTIDERKELSSQPYQLYTCATAGATRLEQGKVIRILCDE
jgi:hypothetical protein